MSVLETKLLAQMLTTSIASFESKYGQVEIPDEVRLPVEVK